MSGSGKDKVRQSAAALPQIQETIIMEENEQEEDEEIVLVDKQMPVQRPGAVKPSPSQPRMPGSVKSSVNNLQ